MNVIEQIKQAEIKVAKLVQDARTQAQADLVAAEARIRKTQQEEEARLQAWVESERALARQEAEVEVVAKQENSERIKSELATQATKHHDQAVAAAAQAFDRLTR